MELDLLRLSLVRGLTPRASVVLLETFGTASAVLRAGPASLRVLPSISKQLKASLEQPPSEGEARSVLRRARRLGVRVLSRGDEQYPESLLQIPDPPLVLYARGEPRREEAAVAVVGARKSTVYGRVQAERFAGSMARSGISVVSGLARGVDAAAHEGALAASGRTVAVLGSGLDRIYPPEHRGLAARIAVDGLLLSEFPFGVSPLPWHFPMRNRIIAGFSAAVLVTEGRLKSGSLITARLAADFGRYVFALPGRVDTGLSVGPHELIREGAILVESPEHLLRDLGALPLTAEKLPDLPADPLQQRVLETLDPCEPQGVDEILRKLRESAPAVLGALLALELSERVRVLPGRRYIRTSPARNQ